MKGIFIGLIYLNKIPLSGVVFDATVPSSSQKRASAAFLLKSIKARTHVSELFPKPYQGPNYRPPKRKKILGKKFLLTSL